MKVQSSQSSSSESSMYSLSSAHPAPVHPLLESSFSPTSKPRGCPEIGLLPHREPFTGESPTDTWLLPRFKRHPLDTSCNSCASELARCRGHGSAVTNPPAQSPSESCLSSRTALDTFHRRDRVSSKQMSEICTTTGSDIRSMPPRDALAGIGTGSIQRNRSLQRAMDANRPAAHSS